MANADEKKIGHRVIAELFEPKVHDMGGGLRIISLTQGWMTVEKRDLIVKAVQSYIRD